MTSVEDTIKNIVEDTLKVFIRPKDSPERSPEGILIEGENQVDRVIEEIRRKYDELNRKVVIRRLNEGETPPRTYYTIDLRHYFG